jgi:hypothetical protein
MKKWFLFALCFQSLLASSILAHPVEFFLKAESGEICFFFRNESPTEKFVFPYFKRDVNPLVLITFEDGSLLKDEYAKKIAPRSYNMGYHSERVIFISPLERSSCVLGIRSWPKKFQICKDGRYYIIAYLKKGDKWHEGLISSNILSFEVENGKIKDSKEVSRETLPAKIRASFDYELKQVELEETHVMPNSW